MSLCINAINTSAGGACPDALGRAARNDRGIGLTDIHPSRRKDKLAANLVIE
jgi:hypothetical protein